ncbi:MAG: hypothetical protein M3081_10765 [Gemmatimonadota bacterium]|nr:hypothetical protein [Gemmatimonadota bacterium]
MPNKKSDPRPTQAGSEAARGIHTAGNKDNSASNRAGEGSGSAKATPAPSPQGDGDEERAGSEPLDAETSQPHQSGYGSGGHPRTSSDERE